MIIIDDLPTFYQQVPSSKKVLWPVLTACNFCTWTDRIFLDLGTNTCTDRIFQTTYNLQLRLQPKKIIKISLTRFLQTVCKKKPLAMAVGNTLVFTDQR